MIEEILTQTDLEILTEKKKAAAQARVLDYIGIRYRKRPSGTLIVLRSDAFGKSTTH